MAQAPPPIESPHLHIVEHPVLKHKISQLRSHATKPAEFRKLVRDISTLLGVEASKNLSLKLIDGLQSPVAAYQGVEIAHRIGLSPILRAGIGMTDAILDLFPEAPVFYLGLFREKISLQPVEYYQKLPQQPTVDTVYILDPMIATGGTCEAAILMIQDWGIPASNIKVLCLLASQAGVNRILTECPGVDIWVGAVDAELTADGMIRPGLGDSGDRLFSTLG